MMTAFAAFTPPPVSLLYVPGHKPRALDKARALPADMIIIDLEDAVPDALKGEGRAGARNALAAGFGDRIVAIRINAPGSPHHQADIDLLRAVRVDAVVLPKVEAAEDLDAPAAATGLPLIPMIESPAGVYAARAIAMHAATAGLMAGLNDLAHSLRLPGGTDRAAMALALQAIVLAARAAGVCVFDGVYNAIDDADGFVRDVADGVRLGFDGKSLIHPAQVNPCNRLFAPSADRLAAAEALVAAAQGGAQRHEGAMVEDMHVAAARLLIEQQRLRSQRRLGMTQI